MVDRHSRATLVMKAEANPILTGRTDLNSLSPDIVINPIDGWARDSLNYERGKCSLEQYRLLLTYHTSNGSRAIGFENSLRCCKIRKTSMDDTAAVAASST